MVPASSTTNEKGEQNMFNKNDFLDKHESAGVSSSGLNQLGPVQRSLGSDFPEPEESFFPQVKPKKIKKVIKKTKKVTKNQKIKLNPK